MRILSPFAQTHESVQPFLNKLVDINTGHNEYADSFYHLGEILSSIINEEYLLNDKHVTLACSSEDADWLTKGIFDHVNAASLSLAVFWNLRVNPIDEQKDLAIAPIIKSYIEEIGQTDTLVICKSIIYTSCVIRTNLTYLIEKINPAQIVIAAPVIFSGAELSLRNEFAASIADKFNFIYFAKDDEVNNNGEVIPGIGGSVYNRLGLSDAVTKNKFIPQLVKTRRAQMSS